MAPARQKTITKTGHSSPAGRAPTRDCKTSTHYTCTKNGTCQAKVEHENSAFIARQDGLLQKDGTCQAKANHENRAMIARRDAYPQKKPPDERQAAFVAYFWLSTRYSKGTINNATILIILINGLIAGPAVSLYGSPTVSPVTAALCASDPLPP
jgi:hypothetical protein